MRMLATEYYWTRAGEALAKADRSSVSDCFVSIAMIYRSLAHGEGELQKQFPNIPPRHIDGQLERRPVSIGQTEAVQKDIIPVPDVTRGWGIAGNRFDVLMSRVVP